MITTWTPQKAADETGTSRSTIMRMINDDKLPNATKRGGTWKIPVPDLIAAGLHPGRPKPGENDDQDTDHSLTDELSRLTAELSSEQQRRAVAEARAEERQKTIEALTETISDYRRMLPPAPTPEQTTSVPESPTSPEPTPSAPAPERPGWIGRVKQWLS